MIPNGQTAEPYGSVRMARGQPGGASAARRDTAPEREPGDSVGSAATAVLVVEDDDSIAEPLSEGLAYAGFQVRRVRTGSEALAEPEADLILLDLGLPDVDGGEVYRQLRSQSAAPIIVVTARGDELDRAQGAAAAQSRWPRGKSRRVAVQGTCRTGSFGPVRPAGRRFPRGLLLCTPTAARSAMDVRTESVPRWSPNRRRPRFGTERDTT